MDLDDRALRASWADAATVPFWLDRPERPPARPALDGDTTTDLLVVGGGFTGLWTALMAKERDPQREVLLIEATRVADAATGRNGGFCSASLTHGEANGRERWPGEYEQLHRLGLENLDEIAATIQRYGIDCDFERTGELSVATRPHELAAYEPKAAGFLDATALRAEVDSPTYLGGTWDRTGTAMIDPARLAWGLAAAAEAAGVRIVEHTRATRLRRSTGGVTVTTEHGIVTATHLALATNAFAPLLARLRFHTVPVWDYVLMTEPLTPAQLDAIGWSNRQGVADSGNQFHYYRLTADHRILWGGYDAIYHFGRAIRPEHEQREATFQALATNFFTTFPQLAGLRFSHRWGGVIDTCTRFCAFFGTSHGGRVAYATGYTGLGVGASRFGANVVLDLLAGTPTERTRLQMVRRKPLPFPPEPFAWIGITITTWSLKRADRTGRRNPWLRVLDRLGLGFDS
ncbi:NAD(P)/FAD-dependent oxidoreductase [Aeromicrobium wangtongii]|uniref:FAD-binding oxidoreductase n=1 Tax=Aeromicrobium wangtongii TaxID=2969247 RepID=A0ABY5MBG0_9ACTN|nr:FAD-binding oxidoreductase [Aeromicrobium wangtongii]MCD9196826.1 FAD-binding oxidoreductase [Aeromicrobium wangtongii]UUP14335.1 FAD-binding oxidoreductase [Aeromicrobium wangtongii]